jgi:hypothetical protein
MPIQIKSEPNDLFVLRISGILKQSEFSAEQNAIAGQIDTGSKPRLLAILENFEGWERGTYWNDLDFAISHGGEIDKIAIVAEPRWETLGSASLATGILVLYATLDRRLLPPGALDKNATYIGQVYEIPGFL